MADRLAPVCEAIARLLSPHAEVVLHDPATDSVIAIWNPLSKRTVGDPSLLGELDELTPAGADVYGPYPKSLPDGRGLSSVSAVIRDDEGRPDVVLCVNVDRSAFDAAARILAAFAAPVAAQPEALFAHDWTERLNETVAGFVRDHATTVDGLSKDQRLDLVAQLASAGVFDQRRSVPTVARAMGISRSAVYQLLALTRKEPADADPA
ncbi:PAS domain-containing protein [Kutzneria sp. NPDC051319]|uniref:helix-turn-helix transcriptional regulator n=1 Tax=Kutzneria sp. NPDC051319 TaxID=3155047 RepID=UPI00341A8C7D